VELVGHAQSATVVAVAVLLVVSYEVPPMATEGHLVQTAYAFVQVLAFTVTSVPVWAFP
jgi:hypothetical protein